jgi:hypothetical protein
MIDRKKLLVFMYWYTAIGAGSFGLAIILLPSLTGDIVRVLMPFPEQDPFVFGYMGSALLAFGILGALGIFRPRKFVPVLMLQLVYKSIWICGVIIPNAVRGEHPVYAILFAAVFLTYIIGDIAVIPFRELMEPEKD